MPFFKDRLHELGGCVLRAIFSGRRIFGGGAKVGNPNMAGGLTRVPTKTPFFAFRRVCNSGRKFPAPQSGQKHALSGRRINSPGLSPPPRYWVPRTPFWGQKCAQSFRGAETAVFPRNPQNNRFHQNTRVPIHNCINVYMHLYTYTFTYRDPVKLVILVIFVYLPPFSCVICPPF
jgi:hypothetical protein